MAKETLPWWHRRWIFNGAWFTFDGFFHSSHVVVKHFLQLLPTILFCDGSEVANVRTGRCRWRAWPFPKICHWWRPWRCLRETCSRILFLWGLPPCGWNSGTCGQFRRQLQFPDTQVIASLCHFINLFTQKANWLNENPVEIIACKDQDQQNVYHNHRYYKQWTVEKTACLPGFFDCHTGPVKVLKPSAGAVKCFFAALKFGFIWPPPLLSALVIAANSGICSSQTLVFLSRNPTFGLRKHIPEYHHRTVAAICLLRSLKCTAVNDVKIQSFWNAKRIILKSSQGQIAPYSILKSKLVFCCNDRVYILSVPMASVAVSIRTPSFTIHLVAFAAKFEALLNKFHKYW